ncbi:MAG: exodeoxyribonuclease VII large subunit, partial [Methylocella sp.]
STQRLVPLVDRLRRQDMTVQIATARRRLQGATQRLHRTTLQIINTRQASLSRASVRVETLSPLAVLSRGYALVYAADGTLLRSAADTAAGQTIRARLARGTLEAEVMRTTIDEVDVTEMNNS